MLLVNLWYGTNTEKQFSILDNDRAVFGLLQETSLHMRSAAARSINL